MGAGSAEGGSCRADQLYDPSVPLLRDVFKHRPGVFPSEDFASPEWLEVSASVACWLYLCYIGIILQVTGSTARSSPHTLLSWLC